MRPTRADFEKERVFFFRFRREGFVFSSRGQFKRASLDEKKAVKSSGQRMSEYACLKKKEHRKEKNKEKEEKKKQRSAPKDE